MAENNISQEDATKYLEQFAQVLKNATENIEELTKAAEAKKKNDEERVRIENLQKAAYTDAKKAVVAFTDSLLAGERGFAKYNQALGSAGDAALEFGKSLGPLGAVLGGIAKAGTMAASAMMKQADDVLKATDNLSKMGTAGAFSAKQVREFGTGLGLASDQLDKFVKPLQSLGYSLTNLGGTAAEGVIEFQSLASELQKHRQEYQRLGISQDELIQSTADFVNLQTMQGRQITEQMKRDGSLRAAAREYTDNLLELSALTGKDIDSIKKKNELALGEIETAIQNNLLDQEINRLRAAGRENEAKQLERERDARDKLLKRVEAEVGDPALRKGLAKFLATGAITEEVAALKRIGVPIEDFAAKIKQGIDVQDEFLDSVSKNGDAMTRNIGTAALFDENTRKAFGISIEYLQYLARARDRDEKSLRDLTNARIADTKAGRGPAGEDPAQIARNALTEAEIAAKVALDNLVASMNPLLTGFGEMNTKIQLLIGAVVAATIALGTMAAVSGARAAAGGVGGAVTGAGGLLGGAAKLLTRGIPLLAGIGALTGGIAGFTADPTASLGGKLSNAASGGLNYLTFGLFGKSPEEMRKASQGNTNAGSALVRERLEQEAILRDQNISDSERKLAERELRTIKIKEAHLKMQDALMEKERATNILAKEAAEAKAERFKKEIIREQYISAFEEEMEKMRREITENSTKQQRELVERKLHFMRNRLNEELTKLAGGSTTSAASDSTALGSAASAVAGMSGVGSGTVSYTKSGKSLNDVISFTSESGSRENFDKLNPNIRGRVIEAASNYNDATGKKIQVNSAVRDIEKQRELYAETERIGTPGRNASGMPVARPGTSKHERGLAIDIQNYNDPIAVAAFNNQGLFQTVPKDPVHFTMPALAMGGRITGPVMALLGEGKEHELVQPLMTNSILDKLSKTPAQQMEQSTSQPMITTLNKTINDNRDMLSLNQAMMNMLSDKLDSMISRLDASVDTQEKLLRYSQA